MDLPSLSCPTKPPVIAEITQKSEDWTEKSDFSGKLSDIVIPETDEEEGTDFSAGSPDEYVPDSYEDAPALADELDNSVIKTADVVLEDLADCGNTDINNKDENGRKILTRKRKIESQKYMQKIRKNHRNQGKPYVTKRGKRVEERVPKPIDCRCRHKCPENFSEEKRKEINADYWNLGDYSKQRLFLANCVKFEKCKRTLTIGSRRANTFKYTLKDKQVCKNFFLNTLNVSDGAISVLSKKMSQNELTDKRGQHGLQRKSDEETVAYIKKHIESFPVVESHYTRAKSQRLYLASNLTTCKMYDLFKELYPDIIVKENVYRRIFCNNYNYYYHRPKKDTCLTCETYKNAEDKESIQQSYDKHILNKKKARYNKQSDKDLDKNNSQLKVFTFDLQSVLTTPCSNVSTMYYSRKFATYNNTFYDIASGDGYCFLWDENQGQRGSDAIGTTILKMMNMLDESVTDVILYSDCCGGQNRNRFIATLLVYMNKTLKLNSITIKYLQSGHAQMEADSMHSAIERANVRQKNGQLY